MSIPMPHKDCPVPNICFSYSDTQLFSEKFTICEDCLKYKYEKKKHLDVMTEFLYDEVKRERLGELLVEFTKGGLTVYDDMEEE